MNVYDPNILLVHKGLRLREGDCLVYDHIVQTKVA